MMEGESAAVNGPDQCKGEELKEDATKTREEGKLIRWISLILLRLKLSFHLSNAIFSMLLDLISFIFWVIRHPLYMLFPKSISDLQTIANLKVLNKTILFAVCPNPKCSCL